MAALFQTVLMRLAVCGLAASLAVLAVFARLAAIWRGLTTFGRFAVCAFLLVGVLEADKTNNVPPNLNAPLPQMMQGGRLSLTGLTGLTGLPSVGNPVNPVNPVQTTSDDIARGWRVESVATNENVSYEMPTNATLVGNWHVHGAASSFGNNRIDFGEWRFPLGTNNAEFSSFWHFIDGRIRPTPHDATHEICAVGVPMSAVPGQSRLWTVEEPDGARVVTWDNFFLGGDTNCPINAQIVLCSNGDFSTRSNDVETACRRVNPDDWDDDGLVNDTDQNPCSFDGDFFGPENILPEGANSNAYCSVSLVATGPDALITFEGDGPSDYPDPQFVARAGATNEVVILIGKTYVVSSDWPFDVVGISDPATEVEPLTGGNVRVVRPVEISFADEGDTPLRSGTGLNSGASGGGNFSALVLPSNLGGEFFFESCCPIEGGGLSFSYLHDMYCSCRGCQPCGRYEYEGFGIAVCPPSCCCSGDSGGGEPGGGEEPSAENPLFASFSLPFALFEDSYLNEIGGSRIGARARPVSLHVGVYGGSYGGNWTLTVANEGRLRQTDGTVARSGIVSAGEALSLELEYVAVSPSDSANDIVVAIAFTENFTGSNSVDTATLTAVKLELEACVTVGDATRRRHYFGVAEDVVCSTTPSAVPGLSFSATKGSYNPATGRWTCPVSTSLEFGGLNVCHGGEPLYAFMTVTTPPTGIVAEHAVGLDFNIPSGTAGGAGMVLDLYVLPKSVSFSKLSLAEVPTTTEGPTGYFTNMEFSAVWYHTPAMGAGRWLPVADYVSVGYWASDRAMMGDAFPSRQAVEWAEGIIVWDVPMAWELTEVLNKAYNKQMPVVYKQRFDFNANGTLRVTKHGFWEERDADDTKRGSEGINVWINPLPES